MIPDGDLLARSYQIPAQGGDWTAILVVHAAAPLEGLGVSVDCRM
jgi:hypothetical protein